MSQSMSLNSINKYEVQIYGPPNASWLDWLGEAEAHVETLVDEKQITIFSNVIMDQAALVGLIRRLHGLGIVLICVRRLEIGLDGDGNPG